MTECTRNGRVAHRDVPKEVYAETNERVGSNARVPWNERTTASSRVALAIAGAHPLADQKAQFPGQRRVDSNGGPACERGMFLAAADAGRPLELADLGSESAKLAVREVPA